MTQMFNRSNIQARFQASGLAHILASISTFFALSGDSLYFFGDRGSSSQAEMLKDYMQSL